MIEIMQCDRCSDEGTEYTVTFDAEGAREFILCPKHSGPLEKLRDLPYGTWKKKRPPRKRGIQKVNLDEVPKKKP